MKALLTGGAGFLGRGIFRHVERCGLEWDITVYSRDETKQDEVRQRWPRARFVLGDVRDTDLLTAAAIGHDVIIHAAALKYIPEAELNATECCNVNIGGAQSVVRAARFAGVPKVVGISTDKAVQPVNIYGASKMAMERIFAESSGPHTSFYCVRYGNVIGSTGSVIPFFQRQAREDNRITITDSNMTRFWMSVDDAIGLIRVVLDGHVSPGSIVIPEATAMNMADVAKAAAPGVKVEMIGMRPGEKMHERLLHNEESVRTKRRNNFIELLRPGTPATEEPFVLSSSNPHHRMSVEKMHELIDDAKELEI